MTTRIAQRELRNNNADILNRVENGETFVVTRNGVAVADVVPHVARTAPPRFPKTKNLVTARKTGEQSAVDGNAWLRDIRDADTIIDDDPLDSRG